MAYFDSLLQRKQEIEEILLEQMRDTPYEQITVKQLTDNMQIARKTFYHYFPSKQACLESLMDRLILESNLHVMSLPENTQQYDIYRKRLEFWIRHKTFLDAVIRNNLSSILVERATLYIRQEDSTLQTRLSTDEIGCDEDVLFCYLTCQISLILKWCSEGFVRPLDEMAQISLRLAHQPLLARQTE